MIALSEQSRAIENLAVMQLALLPATLPGEKHCAFFQVGKRLYPHRRRGRWVDDEYDRRAAAFLIELMPTVRFLIREVWQRMSGMSS